MLGLVSGWTLQRFQCFHKQSWTKVSRLLKWIYFPFCFFLLVQEHLHCLSGLVSVPSLQQDLWQQQHIFWGAKAPVCFFFISQINERGTSFKASFCSFFTTALIRVLEHSQLRSQKGCGRVGTCSMSWAQGWDVHCAIISLMKWQTK